MWPRKIEFTMMPCLVRAALSNFDSHALPKRNAALDFLGGRFWIGIIPGGVLIPHAVHLEMVIIRGTLPRANGSVSARPEKFFLHRFQRKVLIPFHDHAGIAFRDHFSAPRCIRHFVPRRTKSLTTEYRCQAKLSRCQTWAPEPLVWEYDVGRKRFTISRKNSARMSRNQAEVYR